MFCENHSFSTFAKFFEKLIFLTPWYFDFIRNLFARIVIKFLYIKKKKIYGPFLWMRFNCLKSRATSRRQFTSYQSCYETPGDSWLEVWVECIEEYRFIEVVTTVAKSWQWGSEVEDEKICFFCLFSRLMALKRMGIVNNYEVDFCWNLLTDKQIAYFQWNPP